ncbi:MAG: hydrolase 1, exosortase A system-associated [Rhodocyclaceae bacterium]
MSRIVTDFACAGQRLPAIIEGADAPADVGVLVIVGGPQYRVGSHRQFVLLARALASAGVPCMRFDYRGMGDAPGEGQDFEACAADIDAAITALLSALPHLRRVVLWGLCDGASAAVFAAAHDARVAGLVLLNPWVRTEQGEAAALVRGYYGRRLMSPALWRKIARGDVALWRSLREFVGHWHTARRARQAPAAVAGASLWQRQRPLPQRLSEALRAFARPVQIVLSGSDLVAEEFRQAALQAPLAEVVRAPAVRWHEVPAATHTFSSAAWRDEVAATTIAFVRTL